jgi:hypothetical protein
MGRKDASHGSLRAGDKSNQQALESKAVYTNSGNVNKILIDDKLSDFSHPSYMKEGVTPDNNYLKSGLKSAALRLPVRNTFGSTTNHAGSSRPLDKPRGNVAILQPSKIGHGAHPEGRARAMGKIAEFT